MRSTPDSRTLVACCFILLWIGLSDQRSAKIEVFVGSQNSRNGEGIPTRMFPDLTSNFTIISSEDFACVEENGCFLHPDEMSTVINGRNVAYRLAEVQINLRQPPFANKTLVAYLENDLYGFDSMIGLSNDSPFLQYLYIQDRSVGSSINFSIDGGNVLNTHAKLSEASLLDIQQVYPSTAYFYNSSEILTSAKFNFCISNKLDRFSPEVYFGVKIETLDFWRNVISTGALLTSSDKLNSIRFSIFRNESSLIGNFDVSYSDLYANGTILIIGFDDFFDQNRNCDIITGFLFLKQFQFSYQYNEGVDNFYITTSMKNYDTSPTTEPQISRRKIPMNVWIKLGILILILIAIGFCVKKCFCSQPDYLEEYKLQRSKKNEIEMHEIKIDTDTTTKSNHGEV